MKKIICRAVCIILCLILNISLLPVVSTASVSNRVYADPIETIPGETISIPVYIENNTGLMGFALLIKYDSGVFTPVSVQKGSVLTGGMFDDNIGTGNKDTVIIVWSGTDDLKKDGELCVLKFKVNDDVSGSYMISMTYSKGDTFDGNYKDVSLTCENIKINTPLPAPVQPQETKTSQKIRNWLNSLPSVLKYMLYIFVMPVVLIISLFE